MSHPAPRRQSNTGAATLRCRRAWVRHSCQLDGSCEVVNVIRENSWPASVQDVSRGGARLVLSRRFEIGTPLFIDIRKPDGTPFGTRVAQVVHVQRTPGRQWSVGCAFVHPLTEDDLLSLVPDASPDPDE
jgi:hypothetical protein